MSLGSYLGIFLIGIFCQEPPLESQKTEIDKIKDAASIQTETPIGKISMAVSGVEAGEGIPRSSAQLELGVVNIQELGGFIPRRIEFTPFVYNQVEATADDKLNLQKDQGLGLKVKMGNPDLEWAIIMKASLSTENFTEPVRVPTSQADQIQGMIQLIFERSIGGENPKRAQILQRLKNLPVPMIVYVENADFDQKNSRSEAEIKIIHRSIMTTYFYEAMKLWLEKQSNQERALEDLSIILSTPYSLHEWIRRMLLSGKPLYIEAQDRRQIYVRPAKFTQPIAIKEPHLFDPAQMLRDFVEALDYSKPEAGLGIPKSEFRSASRVQGENVPLPKSE